MGLQFSALESINTSLPRSVILVARPIDIAKLHLNTIRNRDSGTYSVLKFDKNRVRRPIQDVSRPTN